MISNHDHGKCSLCIDDSNARIGISVIFIKPINTYNMNSIAGCLHFPWIEKKKHLSPTEIIHAISKIDPEKGRLMIQRLGTLEFKFILNQFRKQTDVNLGDKIEKVCNRHFYTRFRFLGNVSFDEKVHSSILMKEVYIHKYPYTLTAIDLQNISRIIAEKGSHIQIPLWKTW